MSLARTRSIARRSLGGDERGASLAEYVFVVGLVAIVGLLGVRALGASVDHKIQCQAATLAGDASACEGAGTPGAYALAAPADANGPGANGAGEPSTAGAAETAGSTQGDAAGAGAAPGAKALPVIAHEKTPLDHLLGYWGGIGGGAWDDVKGTWQMVRHPWQTVKDIGKGVYERTKSRAEADAAKAMDQWKNGDHKGAAWTLAKGGWSSTSGLAVETLFIDEAVQEDWKKGNRAGAAGRVVWNVGSMFIPGVNLGKVGSKLGKLGKLARARRGADVPDGNAPDGNAPDGNAPHGDPDAPAGSSRPDVDQATIDRNNAAALAAAGLTPDSVVYRTMDPRYLDPATGTVGPNPRSGALVEDPYHPIDNPVAHYAASQGDPIPGMPMQIPGRPAAEEVGPGLNVARERPDIYHAPGQVTVAIKVSDLLANGGVVYRDISGAPGVGPLYITYDGRVPYTVVE